MLCSFNLSRYNVRCLIHNAGQQHHTTSSCYYYTTTYYITMCYFPPITGFHFSLLSGHVNDQDTFFAFVILV